MVTGGSSMSTPTSMGKHVDRTISWWRVRAGAPPCLACSPCEVDLEAWNKREEGEDGSGWGMVPLVSEGERGGYQGYFRPYEKSVSAHTPARGPDSVGTYKVAWFKQHVNCNGKFPNRRIVIVVLKTPKIVMAWIQITLIIMHMLCHWLRIRNEWSYHTGML